jgi:nitrite reductase/ring-hydroxylating ferredoxin subunit
MPFGWFQVLYSGELGIGEAKPITYFDRDLVIFRTESGVAKVIDAYCAHMGAHLGYGIREHAGSAAAVEVRISYAHFTGGSLMVKGNVSIFPTRKTFLREWHAEKR